VVPLADPLIGSLESEVPDDDLVGALDDGSTVGCWSEPAQSERKAHAGGWLFDVSGIVPDGSDGTVIGPIPGSVDALPDPASAQLVLVVDAGAANPDAGDPTTAIPAAISNAATPPRHHRIQAGILI